MCLQNYIPYLVGNVQNDNGNNIRTLSLKLTPEKTRNYMLQNRVDKNWKIVKSKTA